MEIIYVFLVILSMVLLGLNMDIILSLSYDLGYVIKGRLNRNFFIKKVILGIFIFLVCTLMALLLTGKFALICTTIILAGSPILFLIGLGFSLTGQKFNQARILDLVIYLIIIKNRKSGK